MTQHKKKMYNVTLPSYTKSLAQSQRRAIRRFRQCDHTDRLSSANADASRANILQIFFFIYIFFDVEKRTLLEKNCNICTVKVLVPPSCVMRCQLTFYFFILVLHFLLFELLSHYFLIICILLPQLNTPTTMPTTMNRSGSHRAQPP